MISLWGDLMAEIEWKFYSSVSLAYNKTNNDCVCITLEIFNANETLAIDIVMLGCLSRWTLSIFSPWIIASKCMEKLTIFSRGRGWQGTGNSSASVNCRENLSLHLFPSLLPLFSSASSPLHRSLFLCGSWTPQMRRNGKWSETMAFKALPLPCPNLFIFYPNKWWSKKTKIAKLWNKSTRD